MEEVFHDEQSDFQNSEQKNWDEVPAAEVLQLPLTAWNLECLLWRPHFSESIQTPSQFSGSG
jgi:hypothetical protein